MATIERARAPISEPTRRDAVEIDSFAPSNAATRERSSLVIVSYNIRYCVGSFLITGGIGRRLGLTLPGRRTRLVNRHLQKAALVLSDGRRLPSADIVALQETDRLTARAGGTHDIARQLARALQMSYARATAQAAREEEPQARKWYLDFEEHIPTTDTGDTGIAILSRLALASASRVELPWETCEWRPRLALKAVIHNGAQSLTVFNMHIDPHAAIEGQLEQHRAVLARAEDLTGPIVLLGDFNTLSRRARREVRRLMEANGFSTPMPSGTSTWRAGLIRLHTDWIFVRGLRVKNWGVARLRGISDHWPVWVEVDLQES